MSWTDKQSLATIKQLRDDFKIKHFIETGTYKGINADVHSKNFDYVFTCDINTTSLNEAQARLDSKPNVYVFNSPSVLTIGAARQFYDKNKREDILFFYLDAHFYDSRLPKDKRFVVLDELEALKGFKNAVIAIHDFDCEGLGHITYDGISLDWNLIRQKVQAINPRACIYTNTPEGCDIFTPETIGELEIKVDAAVLDNLAYAWSDPSKTKRGIIYITPIELDLTKYKGLKRQEWI